MFSTQNCTIDCIQFHITQTSKVIKSSETSVIHSISGSIKRTASGTLSHSGYFAIQEVLTVERFSKHIGHQTPEHNLMPGFSDMEALVQKNHWFEHIAFLISDIIPTKFLEQQDRLRNLLLKFSVLINVT